MAHPAPGMQTRASMREIMSMAAPSTIVLVSLTLVLSEQIWSSDPYRRLVSLAAPLCIASFRRYPRRPAPLFSFLMPSSLGCDGASTLTM